MSTPESATPRPKLRPTGAGASDHRPPARPETGGRRGEPGADTASGPTLPVRVVLLVGLVVLVLLAALRPGGVTAVLGVPLAVVLPGAVLQPRFLPGLRTDPVTRWCLRGALSLAGWVVVGLAVAAAGIPVRSVWTVVVAAVLLAALVIGEPEGERRFGVVGARQVGWGVAAVLVAAVLALGARGLVAIGAPEPTGGGSPVLVTFADPTVPVALAATGARATVEVALTNTSDDAVELAVGGQVGRALPWPDVRVEVPAGATRYVEVGGGLPVCSDPQQAVVTVTGAGPVPPLAAVLPGTAGAIACSAS